MKKAIPYILIGLLAGAGLMYVLGPARFPNERRPAEPTSFRAVAGRLDAGGDMYAYLNAERLVRAVEELGGKLVQGLAGQMSESDAAGFAAVLRLIGHLGLGEISGVGFSSVSVAPELHRAKMVLHHDPAKNKGLIWQLGGASPRALTELDLLPADTGFALFGELRLDNVWTWLKAELVESKIPGAQKFVREAEPALAAQGIKLDELLSSLTGSVGLFITLDPERRITLPGGPSETPLTIPEPGLALVVGVKNPYLFDLLKGKLPMARFAEKPGRRTLQFSTIAAPFPLEPGLTEVKDYLIVSTTPQLAEAVLQARAKGDGLRLNKEFTALARHAPAKGNGFTYFSPRLWKIYADVLGQASGDGPDAKLNEFIFSFFPKELKGYGVFENRPDGATWTYCHNLKPEVMLFLPVVTIAGVAAAVALPNYQQASEKARQMNTLSDLKTVSTAIESYIVDNAKAPGASSYGELKPILEPSYIKSLPLQDAWGNDFLYRKLGPDSYELASPGRDGVFGGWGQKGTYTDGMFDNDLIVSSGTVVFGPGKK